MMALSSIGVRSAIDKKCRGVNADGDCEVEGDGADEVKGLRSCGRVAL